MLSYKSSLDNFGLSMLPTLDTGQLYCTLDNWNKMAKLTGNTNKDKLKIDVGVIFVCVLVDRREIAAYDQREIICCFGKFCMSNILDFTKLCQCQCFVQLTKIKWKCNLNCETTITFKTMKLNLH